MISCCSWSFSAERKPRNGGESPQTITGHCIDITGKMAKVHVVPAQSSEARSVSHAFLRANLAAISALALSFKDAALDEAEAEEDERTAEGGCELEERKV